MQKINKYKIMNKILILTFIINLISAPVFPYCYSLDPVTYNACIQQENQHNQMMQQQLEFQKRMLNIQLYCLEQAQQNNSYNHRNYNYFTGNLKLDYARHRRDAVLGRDIYISKEDFTKAYN